jgi:hypothetical protein
MNNKYIKLVFLTFISAIVSFGCTPEGQSALSSPSEAFKTATITTISTSTPSMTVTFTQTPSFTATLTPLPSLSPENALQIINQHFQEGEQCIEPCFFGVVPGKTTIGEAQNIFLQLGMPIDFIVPENDKKIYSTLRGLENGIGVAIMVTVHNGLVEDISLGIQPPDESKSLQANGLSGYSINYILEQYGIPSAVEFHVSYPHEPGFPPGTAWYDMTVYFEDSNVIVLYRDALVQEGDILGQVL